MGVLLTSDVAEMCGVSSKKLRTAVQDGYLKLGPHGETGQGRGNQNNWTNAAAREAISYFANQKKNKAKQHDKV